MNKITFRGILVSLFFGIVSLGNCQTAQTPQNDQTKKFKYSKYLMTEYMLSCQSTANLLLSEQDQNKKSDLGLIGYKYYNNAYQEFIVLQTSAYGKLTSQMDSIISPILSTYEQIFSRVSRWNDPQQAVSLAFILHGTDIELEWVLPKLWGTE